MDSSQQLKDHITKIVSAKMNQMKIRLQAQDDMNSSEATSQLNMRVLNDIIGRRGYTNRDLFKQFYLKYLTPSLREIVWRGLLSDTGKQREIEGIIKNNRSFSISKDERQITAQLNLALNSVQHSINADSYEVMTTLKEILIYFQNYYRIDSLPPSIGSVLIPIVQQFQNSKFSGSMEVELVTYLFTFYETVYDPILQSATNNMDHEYSARVQLQTLSDFLNQNDREITIKLQQLLRQDDQEVFNEYSKITSNSSSVLLQGLSKQELILYSLINDFAEKLSVSYFSMKATFVLWDFLLIKPMKEKNDLINIIALILSQSKQAFTGCQNIVQLKNLFKQITSTIHEYDLYLLIFNHYKNLDIPQPIQEQQQQESIKKSIPDLTSLMGQGLKQKFQQQQQQAIMRNSQMFQNNVNPLNQSSYLQAQKSQANIPIQEQAYAAQRPGVIKHTYENDMKIKALAQSVIGVVNMQELEYDLLQYL